MAKKPASTPARQPAAPAMASASHNDHGHAAGGAMAIPEMDYPAHEAMYEKFTGMVKWGIVGAVVLVIFLFLVIHPMVPVVAS